AEYDAHWAYVKPARPAVPEVHDKQWPVNAIDDFILAKLEAKGLTPAPEADQRTLLRRLSFDLTGLPPTQEQLDRFRPEEKEYEAIVDRLLASPHFGERMALYWL